MSEPSVAPEPAPLAVHDAGEIGAGETGVWQRRFNSFWREWLKPLSIIALVMFSFRSAVADWNDVPTGSMKPTIIEGDRIFINKIAYDLKFPFTTWRIAEWADPQWGDIVVLRSPDDDSRLLKRRLVKRVVGLPGDVIEIRNNHLFVNGSQAKYEPIFGEQPPGQLVVLEEVHGREHPVMLSSRYSTSGPFVVPSGQFFVMGDNRDNSRDSRYFGPVDRAAILGKATAVAASLDLNNRYLYYFPLPIPRWDRFFTALP